jgi:protein-S-isoprenylcysteine O-methyltransferase Ste14
MRGDASGHPHDGEGLPARDTGRCALLAFGGGRFIGPMATVKLRALIGSGDKIGLFTLPFVIVGLILNVAFPDVFSVGGPPPALGVIAAAGLAVGVAIWAWSIILIVTRVPRGQLITNGPYALMKHPLYTAVALLVLPGLGLLLDTWLGVPVGLAMYLGSRRFAPAEEEHLSRTFGEAWTAYARTVKFPWL